MIEKLINQKAFCLMKKMKSLQDLFVEQLRDMYYAEKQQVKSLNKMIKKASSEKLKKALEDHVSETESQVERLEQVFEKLELTARGKTCHAMDGIIDEAKEIMNEDAEPAVLDAGIIAAAQKAEHYEIASYGTLRSYAEKLGYSKITNLLQQTLDEEANTDKKLSKIAQTVNEDAMEGATSGSSSSSSSSKSSSSSSSRGGSSSSGSRR
jgi:ferritin-like metal-binding protein YciE